MKRILAVFLVVLMMLSVLCAAGAEEKVLYGFATERLATRDGPGTNYNQTGVYEAVAYHYVRILSRAWDEHNKIWWVKCEIPYQGEIRVLWTGYWRFDPESLPLESIPIEIPDPPRDSVAEEEWPYAYKYFISSGKYDAAIQNPNRETQGMLQERDRQLDSFILQDLDGNYIPELIVWTSFGLEQADVFTWIDGEVTWVGRIGGDNFFQGFLSYEQYPQAGLITLEGGPAMKIRAFTIDETHMQEQLIGETLVDSEGMETTGIRLYSPGGTLAQLLENTLVGGDLSAMLTGWCTLGMLKDDNQWDQLLP